MKKEIYEKMKLIINYFDDWADALFLNAPQDFIQNNYSENKIYRLISNAFQTDSSLDLNKLKNNSYYTDFYKNMYEWQSLYENKMFQNPKSGEILNSIIKLSLDLLEDFEKNIDEFKDHKYAIAEILELKSNINYWTENEISKTELENLLPKTFNLIEKTYVEMAYSQIDSTLRDKNVDLSTFWEEPIMEYIMETWWPKRRVYKNKILMIDVKNYPDKLDFYWKKYMSDKFYSSGIYNFLKQLRNQLTHVKTSEYHNKVIEELFSRDFLIYWCKMNCTIVAYIISYMLLESD